MRITLDEGLEQCGEQLEWPNCTKTVYRFTRAVASRHEREKGLFHHFSNLTFCRVVEWAGQAAWLLGARNRYMRKRDGFLYQTKQRIQRGPVARESDDTF